MHVHGPIQFFKFEFLSWTFGRLHTFSVSSSTQSDIVLPFQTAICHFYQICSVSNLHFLKQKNLQNKDSSKNRSPRVYTIFRTKDCFEDDGFYGGIK